MASGGYSLLAFCGLLIVVASLVVALHGSRHMGFSGCGPRALLLHSKWNPPRPGIEPTSPALVGGFLTTGPPGKSPRYILQREENASLLFAAWRNLG